MKLTFLRIATLFLFFCSGVFAQGEIDVQSMKITRTAATGITNITITALDSKGNTLTFVEADTGFVGGLIDFERCRDCRAPNLYKTNPFVHDNPAIAELNNLNNHYLRFYFDSSSSDLLYLNQRDMIRKSSFYKGGKVRVEGRIDVSINLGEIVAFDNDVVLEGRYSIHFGKPYFPLPNGGRWTYARDVTYFLTKPAE